MKFISHLLTGVIVLILFYFILQPNLSVLIPSSIALLIGSVLPDLDHPFSYVRKTIVPETFTRIALPNIEKKSDVKKSIWAD